MIDVTTFIIATYMLACSGAILFAVITLYFHRLYSRRYLLFWAMSWFALGVYLLGGAFAAYNAGTLPAAHPVRLLSSFLTMTAAYVQIAWLLFGAYELSTNRDVAPVLFRWSLVGILALAVFMTLAFVFDPDAGPTRYLLRVGLKNLLTGLSFLGGGYALFFRWTKQKSLGRTLVSLAFGVYGLSLLAQVFPSLLYVLNEARASLVLVPFFALFDFLLLFVTGLGLVLWLFEEERTKADRAAATLLESEAMMRSISESAPANIIKIDLDGAILFINRTVPDLTVEEVIGTSVHNYVPERFQAIAQAAFDRVIETGQPDQYEVEYHTKDGAVWTFEARVGPVMQNGQVVALTIISTNVTERKQAQADRERLITELEAKNAELERFTYTVSHDLKSPLVTIKGFLGLLQQDALAGDLEQMNRDIEHINHATDKMHQLLGELLELSRIGRLMNPPESVALSDLVHDAVALVAGRLVARGVSVEIAPELPQVVGDRVRLLEVYQNLIDNAVKFMGEEREPRLEIGARVNGTEVECWVRDNGMGIAPSYHEKVFGLFERLEAGGEGTGIGLALVRRIVEVHGGRIWVESEGRGHGCTFWFTLPRMEALEAL